MLGLGRNLLSRKEPWKEPWSCSWPWNCVTQGLQSLSHCRASHSAGLTKMLTFTPGPFKHAQNMFTSPWESQEVVSQNNPTGPYLCAGVPDLEAGIEHHGNVFSNVTDVIKQNIININNIPGTQTDKSCSPVPGPGRELSSLWSHQNSWGSGRAEGLTALPCTQLKILPYFTLSAKQAKNSDSPVPPHSLAGDQPSSFLTC